MQSSPCIFHKGIEQERTAKQAQCPGDSPGVIRRSRGNFANHPRTDDGHAERDQHRSDHRADPRHWNKKQNIAVEQTRRPVDSQLQPDIVPDIPDTEEKEKPAVPIPALFPNNKSDAHQDHQGSQFTTKLYRHDRLWYRFERKSNPLRVV